MNFVSTAKSAYASAAQAAGKGLRKVGVLGTEAPDRADRWKHWAYSLTSAHDSLAIAELDVPWWTYGAIDEVDEWLAGRSDVSVFEWGSGASTMWLARRTARIESVEHHRGFGEMMQRELAARTWDAGHLNLTIIEPEPAEQPVIGSAKEGQAGLDFERYVHHIHEVGGEFDLIVVDGRAREACLRAGLEHLADDGIIVFDNTMRRRYRQAIDEARVTETIHRGLTPTLPYPDQTSIIRPRSV